jgi:hypothetical protein
MLHTLRHRIASCALALLFVQTAGVFAVPMAMGCPGDTHAAAAQDEDCCPAGSHAPGQCPLHARAKTTGADKEEHASCRMRCDAPHGVQLLVGAVAVLPISSRITIALTDRGAARVASTTAVLRSTIPSAPPPRTL